MGSISNNTFGTITDAPREASISDNRIGSVSALDHFTINNRIGGPNDGGITLPPIGDTDGNRLNRLSSGVWVACKAEELRVIDADARIDHMDGIDYGFGALGIQYTGLDSSKGYFGEGSKTNEFLNSDAPVTQDISLGTGDWTLSVHGTGSVTSSANTATGTGFGAASDGSDNTFNITGAGTVTFTVSGSPDYVQVESGSSSTSPIVTAGSPVTRLTDTGATIPLSYFSDSIGSIEFELTPFFLGEIVGVNAGIMTPNANQQRFVYLNGGAANTLRSSEGATGFNIGTWSSLGETVKVKLRWNANLGEKNASVNGVVAGSVAFSGTWSPAGNITLFKSLLHGAAIKNIKLYSTDNGDNWLAT